MTKIWQQIILSAVVLVCSANVFGQAKSFCENDPRPGVRAYCKDLADFQNAVNAGTATSADGSSAFLNKLDFSHAAATNKFITAATPLLVVNAALTKFAVSGALQDAGQARPDRQLGAPGSASGTTTLVSKPGSAELLSLALDTGALTRSVNGTTATLTSNGDQLFRLITGNDPDCTVTCNGHGWFQNKVLTATNISASLDLAQQSSTTVATTGQASGTTPVDVGEAAIPTGAGKLSGVSVRYQLMNGFDPRSAKFRESWKNAVLQSTDLNAAVLNLQTATEQVMTPLTASANALDREKAFAAAKADTTGRALADFFDAYFSNVSNTVRQDPKLSAAILAVMPLRSVYRQAWFDALHQAAGTLLTFEYDYNRPANEPITHDIKLIYGYDFGVRGMVTFNGAASFYGGAIPAGAKYGRLHYGQVSTEYDRTLSGKNSPFQTQMSLAGYWQYQPNPSVLDIPAGTVAPGTTIPIPNGTQEFVGTAGSLWVTQAKLTIKGAGGVNIPIAVSWSNKTDLLQGSKIGAQVGISYNFSSVAGLFTGSGSH
jgi:hypothetical protein